MCGLGLILTGLIAFWAGIAFENGDITAAVFFWIFGIPMLIDDIMEGIKVKQRRVSKFGKIIKRRLVEMNITQRELAKDVGMKTQYLNDIISGRRSGRKYRRQICRELGLDTERVFKEIAS